MSRKYPPGPRDFAFGFRTTRRMKYDVMGTAVAFQREFGDVVSIKVGPYRLYFFYHPDQVREVLVTKSKSTIRFPRIMRTFQQWNGNSLLIAEGEAWARQRRLVQQGFQPHRMTQYAETVVATARDYSAELSDSISNDTFEIDASQAMSRLALSNICRTMFDVDPEKVPDDIAKAVATLSAIAFDEMQAPIRLPIWLPTPRNARKKWAMQTLDDLVWKIIRERRASGHDGNDLLSILLHAVDDESGGFKLDDRQVRDEVMTMLLAGYDTTAAGLEWLMYCLARYPQVAEKCHAEVASKGDHPLHLDDIEQMPYLTATVNETLRLYPPAIGIFMRQTTADIEIGGYKLRKGALVTLSSFATHRDERWFPKPETFDPERFLPPRESEIPQFAFFPFGAGPRACIGKMLAMHEMTLTAATLLQSWQMSLPPNAREPELDVKLALRPAEPVKLQFTKRSATDRTATTAHSPRDVRSNAS